MRAHTADQVDDPIKIPLKSRLPALERPSVDPALHVEHRQMGQADPGFPCRGGDPERCLRRVVVAIAARLVMDVVELADRRIAGLKHLDIGERRDRLDIVRRHPVEEAIHQGTPGPEAVAPVGAARFRQPGHGALEGMAVQIARCRQENA